MPALSWSPPSMVTLLHPRGSPGEDTHCVVPILETQAPRIRGLEELAPSLVRGGALAPDLSHTPRPASRVHPPRSRPCWVSGARVLARIHEGDLGARAGPHTWFH